MSYRCEECGDRDCPGCDPADRPRDFHNARSERQRREQQREARIYDTDVVMPATKGPAS